MSEPLIEPIDQVHPELGTLLKAEKSTRHADVEMASRIRSGLGFKLVGVALTGATLGVAATAQGAANVGAAASSSAASGAASSGAAAAKSVAPQAIKGAVAAKGVAAVATAGKVILASKAGVVAVGLAFAAGASVGVTVDRTIEPRRSEVHATSNEVAAEPRAVAIPVIEPPTEPPVNDETPVDPPVETMGVPSEGLQGSERTATNAEITDTENALEAAPRTSRLANERVLLERARNAYTRGLTSDALIALAQHRSRFPSGNLAAERDGLEVLAHYRAGHQSEAHRLAERYLAVHPDGLMVTSVRRVLAATTATANQ